MSTTELERLQRRFAEALLGEGAAGDAVVAELGVVAGGGGLSAEDRLRVYREAFWIRMYENLEEDYPEVSRQLGPEAFRRAVRGFITEHPSAHPSLIVLGEAFAPFMARARPDRPELAELARLEWAKIVVRHAEAPSAPLTAPPQLPPDAYPGLRLEPSPTARLLELSHRVGRWLSLPADRRAAAPIEPGPEVVMVVRRAFVVTVEPVPAPFDRVLARLYAGAALGEAIAALDPESVEPAQVTRAFADFLSRGYFARLAL